MDKQFVVRDTKDRGRGWGYVDFRDGAKRTGNPDKATVFPEGGGVFQAIERNLPRHMVKNGRFVVEEI